MNQYDLCVIGAGIAGLYSGYKWRKQNPTGRIIFVEAGERAGGRMETARFSGIDIAMGAGVGRTDKDVLLAALLRELHIPIHTFEQTVQYGDSINPLSRRYSVFTRVCQISCVARTILGICVHLFHCCKASSTKHYSNQRKQRHLHDSV